MADDRFGIAPNGNGTPATITWSIVPDGTTAIRDTDSNATAPSNLISFMNTNFGGSAGQTNLTLQPWFHIFTDSFGRWSQLGGVDFVYESHDDGVFHPSSNGVLGVRGDIRLAGANVDGSGDVLAFTYLPTGGSDMMIDTAESAFFKNGDSNFINFRDTLMHEIGHAFGLLHVSTSSALLMEPVIDTSFDGPQLDEVRGVQYYFGDVNDKSNGGSGNGTPALATSLGTIAAGGTKTIGAAANVPSQVISAAATDFVSISNLDDTDYYSFAVSAPSLLGATLTPRGGVFTQASQRASSDDVRRERPQQSGPHDIFHQRHNGADDGRRQLGGRNRIDREPCAAGRRHVFRTDNWGRRHDPVVPVVVDGHADLVGRLQQERRGGRSRLRRVAQYAGTIGGDGHGRRRQL